LIDGRWCYIKINKFGETTYPEMLVALAQGMQQNMQGCIIDLRGNTGGYMIAAIQMVNEFLPKGEMIVYTEGVNTPRYEEYANGRGTCQKLPIVVLTDETSASSSEIFAGAIQDNDRGTIIGRRTFGKGLVQQIMSFSDGSSVRLTISRYHTPSGRCIQKPYNKGNREEYDMDILDRYNRGEFFSQDSIHQNKELIYKTKKGRTVYGGGGIMPDIFVSSDTSDITPYANEVLMRGLIAQFTLKYSNNNRHNLAGYTNYEALTAQLDKVQLFDKFVEFAAEKGVKASAQETEKSKRLLKRSLYSNVTYHLLGMCEHVKYINLSDSTVLKAVDVLERGEAFPM
jgi:carboxyl-terminal processing protease